MTAAAYPRPDESGRRNHGSHFEENACQGAKDENREVAKNFGGEELRFRHHAFCINYQDVPSEKSPRTFVAERRRPSYSSPGLQVRQHLAGLAQPANRLAALSTGKRRRRPAAPSFGREREEASRIAPTS